MSRFFFDLYVNDIRMSAWWMRYSNHTTAYMAAYNTNPFSFDYDQSFFRWSTTELPAQFRRGRSIERALIASHRATPPVALIQPCSSVFNLAALGYDYLTSPAVLQMHDIHNLLLRPANLVHDIVPEEMVLDGKASLDAYRLLVIPYGPYLSEEFARALTDWTRAGRHADRLRPVRAHGPVRR